MSISGIDRVTYGVEDIALCRRFFLDWGLSLVRDSDTALDFETLNGCEVFVRLHDDPSLPPAIEAGPTVREVIWSAENDADIAASREKMRNAPGFREADGTLFCTDPNGLAVGVRVTRKRAIEVHGGQTNTWDKASRVNAPSASYDHATPIEVGHVVFFTKQLDETTKFYENIGFCLSDRYPGRGHFLRTAPRGGHHDMFLLQTPEGKPGLNHVAFAVRDIHEVFGGGMHMSRLGWDTQLGPGKHPISSAFFWYFQNPAGALIEYYADEDVLTEEWKTRDFVPGPDLFAEWAISGGIDGKTRRQKSAGAPAPDGKFITEKRS
ncbi:VOC family protein [Methylocella sp. CPCC 101449]|uniref:VOC family protein n=1 Tax=Methylocella sp. CPCC 101449 TaxID=2987531 RepID=UPI002891AF2F|nr:VOC family protein [Methylocella sp. CPCC 101449]MDT2022644.1 VOC family protein [Methylocella sp. CPCC 101449]